MFRRSFLFSSASLLTLAASRPAWAQGREAASAPMPPASSPTAAPFSFDSVAAEARRLSRENHHEIRLNLPKRLRELSYDEYRTIRFKPDAQAWRGENRGFALDFLHSGFRYDQAVQMHQITATGVRDLPFSPDLFDYGTPDIRPKDDDLTFSGFRARYGLNRPDMLDEFLVFQGASYFRAVARDQGYGLSARGLTIRTADPEGEEFSVFTDFWIETPSENATSLRLYALLQSRSVTGAYTFTVRPGEATVMEVDCMLFPRTDLKSVGIAPLTSMFYFSPLDRTGIDDYRVRVHDSSGLQMISGAGERIWRSLNNPAALQVSSFVDTGPKGFGLVQRHRSFTDYQDPEARYDRRPSAWVEPVGNWGPGYVNLVEIPVSNEFNDNIVAFWRPREPLRAGAEYRYSYRLHWCDLPPDEAPLARISEVRAGRAPNTGLRVFVLDFDGVDAAANVITPLVTASSGAISGVYVQQVPEKGVTRLAFNFVPDGTPQSEFRAILRRADGTPLSETWLYRWTA